ncbi:MULTISPECIES: YceI family protein [Pseudomonas]|uniref:YceI family protein n=1 Tax=Pseudomonas piscis TaxID=2614538 RepID=A0ABY9NLM3_9PSED|nr:MULTISPECIES: YceI family protein [Pseudomonas]POA54304.1 YceI family protein [Pseudomonas sp. FW507-12TSA]WMN19137.1 YceI family protein [Pseudomonas piscis]
MRTSIRLLLSLLAVLALPAQANWYLDNESSRISFVTTKNASICEVQRFLVLHGKVDGKGLAQLQLELDSVSSGIPLRDERMRQDLFQVQQFPEARVTAQINLRPINDLANGAQIELLLPITVSLHGQEHTYNAELLATRLDERRFQVVTLEPLVLNAEDFNLAPGLDSLRKVAGLSAISFSVPVGAVLIFTAR